METAVSLSFADGDYLFFLPMARIIAAEREMGDLSIFQLFPQIGDALGTISDRVVLAAPSPAKLNHCHAVIRNALIGGGEPEKQARELVETYCYPARAAILDMELAWRILEATIYGVRLKKKDDVTEGSPSPSEKEP